MSRTAVSFSGGRSSAVMLKEVLRSRRPGDEVIATFANTGCEHEDTLRFVRDVGDYLEAPIVWLEAVVGPPGVGIRHREVTYETASRNGEPFEAYIRKHGLPGPSHPQCTSRLKTEVMEDYFRSIGWRPATRRPEYDTCIGIRADEIDRVSASRKRLRLRYPLIAAGWTKRAVADEVESWGLGFNLPEILGNCVWCWKKSLRKLATISLDHPESFDFPQRMEALGNITGRDVEPRIFRGHRTVADVFEIGRADGFRRWTPAPSQPSLFPPHPLDEGGGCGDSCEIYSDTDGG